MIRTGNLENVFALGDGFAFINENVVTILAEFAQDEALVTTEEIEAAKARAEAALNESASITDEEKRALELTLKRSIVGLQAKRRKQPGFSSSMGPG